MITLETTQGKAAKAKEGYIMRENTRMYPLDQMLLVQKDMKKDFIRLGLPNAN